MTSSQVNVSETPPMSAEDLQTLAKNETDENGLILGKFKSVEDLAASYKELEGKLGTVTEEDQVSESTEETTGVPEGYEEYYQEDGTVDYNSVNENYGEILGEIFKENNIDPYKIDRQHEDSYLPRGLDMTNKFLVNHHTVDDPLECNCVSNHQT